MRSTTLPPLAKISLEPIATQTLATAGTGTELPLATDYPAADLEHLHDIGRLICDARGRLSVPGILLRTAIAGYKLG